MMFPRLMYNFDIRQTQKTLLVEGLLIVGSSIHSKGRESMQLARLALFRPPLDSAPSLHLMRRSLSLKDGYHDA